MIPDNADLSPLFLTFKLAFVTSVTLLFVGIPVAWVLARYRFYGHTLLSALMTMPFVLPPTVLGFYLLLFLGPKGIGLWIESLFGIRLVFTFHGLVIGSVIFSLPFMVEPLKHGFASISRDLIDAARTLGKSGFSIAFRVILPLVLPAIFTGFTMSFAHTVGEFGVVLMLGGNIPGETRVASLAIYDEVESLDYDTAGFYSFVLFAVSFVILLLLHKFNRGREERLL